MSAWPMIELLTPTRIRMILTPTTLTVTFPTKNLWVIMARSMIPGVEVQLEEIRKLKERLVEWHRIRDESEKMHREKVAFCVDMGYTVDFAGAKRDLERHLVEHRNLLAIARGE